MIPLSSELKYCYDYGDGWEVNIICKGVYSLQESDETGQPDAETIRMVIEQEKPVCIAADGLPVMDDVGGIRGYIEFLDTLHHGTPEERQNSREWARSMGWTGRMKQPENIL